MTTPRAQLGRLLVLAAISGLVLHRVGVGGVAAPPWRSWGALQRWYETVGPGAAIVAGVRLLTMGVCVWLVVACGLQILAATFRRASLRGLADRVSPRVVRSLAGGATSLSVIAGLAIPAAAFGPPDAAPGTAVMVPLDTTTTTTTEPPVEPPPTTTTAPSTSTTTTTVPPSPPPPAAPVVPVAPARVSPPLTAEVVVVPGDSFWSIAVDEAEGRDVTTYWQALIEANRDRLVDPSNPDLLYPDQVLRLP